MINKVQEMDLRSVPKSRGTTYIYVLGCVDDKFYIGKSTNLYFRLIQHKSGKGAWFTRKNKPLYVSSWHVQIDDNDEFETWIMYASLWGPENVGGFSRWLCRELGLVYPF